MRGEVFIVVFERREEEIRGWRRGSGGSVLQRYFGAVLEERLKRNRTPASPGTSMVTFLDHFHLPLHSLFTLHSLYLSLVLMGISRLLRYECDAVLFSFGICLF